MKSNEELLREIFARLDGLDYVKPEQIPDIPLYMDQLTTFMDERLAKSKRYPEDKVLTKTMINNYAKNNLLPPPDKKKYTKEHTLLRHRDPVRPHHGGALRGPEPGQGSRFPEGGSVRMVFGGHLSGDLLPGERADEAVKGRSHKKIPLLHEDLLP